MRLAQLIISGLAILGAPAAAAQAVTLPSGETAEPLPVIWDEGAAVLRLRYIVAALGAGDTPYAQDSEAVERDMHWLCDEARGRYEAELGPLPEQGWSGAAVTLMDRDVAFGTVDSAAFQLFEWFQFAQDRCDIDLDIYDDH